MQFQCKCGSEIHDNSDMLYNKAHFISDKKWEVFWNDIDEAIEESGPTPNEKEAACMKLRMKNYSRSLYQCSDCGRIYIHDLSGKLHAFKPEETDTYKTILDEP